MSASNNEFQRLYALGYTRLLPLIPGVGIPKGAGIYYTNRGKMPGEYREYEWGGIKRWSQYQCTVDDLVRWHLMGGGAAGTGILTGEQADGTWLILIDADTLHPDHAATIKAEVDATFGELPVRIGNAPKAAYPLRLSGQLAYKSLKFDDGSEGGGLVEILTAGRQFVAAGIHPKTERPYNWPVPLVPFDKLPIFEPAAVVAFLERLRGLLPESKEVHSGQLRGTAPDQASLRGDTELVRKAVSLIPNTTALFNSRIAWITFGIAVKAAVRDEYEALAIFEEWSERWVEGVNEPDKIAENWRTMTPPFHLGAGYLYDKAAELGGFDKAEIWFVDPDAPEPEPEPDPLNEAETDKPKDDWTFGYRDGDDVEPVDLFGTDDPVNLSEPPAGCLPAIIERWARTESRRKGVSMAFASAASIGVLASAIGSSLRIRPRIHDEGWIEPAALWVALIAEPGRGKSPIISASTKPMARLDAERYAVDQAAHQHWAAAEALHKKGKGPPSGPEPIVRRCLVDDATLERQVRIHADNPRGLLRAPDELLGLFASLGAYKKNGDGDRTQMLRLFDGASVMVDRVGAGSIRADSALMGIVAGTQPEKIRALVKDLGQDGMLQRFIWIMDDGASRRGIDEAQDKAATQAYDRAVRYLATHEHGAASIIEQALDARAVLEEALERIHRLRALPGASTAWKGHVEKWPKLLHRIALVFHAANHVDIAGGLIPGIPFDADTARQTVAYGWFLLKHSLRFYETFFGESAGTSDARSIAGHLLTRSDLKVLDRRDVYRAHRVLQGEGKLPKLLTAMRELEHSGWVEALGRDRDGPLRWSVNQQIHIAFAAHAERERGERAEKVESILAAAAVRREQMG